MGDVVRCQGADGVGARRLREHLLASGSQRRWDRGHRLVRRGDRARAVYLVVEGRLKVTTSSIGGDEAIHAVLGPGDLVGELAALDGQAHVADVVALTPGTGRRIDASRFGELLRGDVDIALAVATMLAGRIRGADEVRADIGAGDVAVRVAHRLWHLTEGAPAGPGGIDVAISQDDLARWCGASRQAVNVALGRLRAAGVVRTGRGVVVVLDRRRLLTGCGTATGT